MYTGVLLNQWPEKAMAIMQENIPIYRLKVDSERRFYLFIIDLKVLLRTLVLFSSLHLSHTTQRHDWLNHWINLYSSSWGRAHSEPREKVRINLSITHLKEISTVFILVFQKNKGWKSQIAAKYSCKLFHCIGYISIKYVKRISLIPINSRPIRLRRIIFAIVCNSLLLSRWGLRCDPDVIC